MNVANCLGDWLGVQYAEFGRVKQDASGVNDVSKAQYFVSEELALGGFEFEASNSMTLENCPEVAQVLGVVARVDYYVVDVRETNARHQSTKHDRHESLLSRRRIAQAERHLGQLEESCVCNELHLFDVGRCDWHLIKPHCEVERREHAASDDGVERFVEARQREAVELGGCVHSTIVHAQSPGAICLLHHHDG